MALMIKRAPVPCVIEPIRAQLQHIARNPTFNNSGHPAHAKSKVPAGRLFGRDAAATAQPSKTLHKYGDTHMRARQVWLHYPSLTA